MAVTEIDRVIRGIIDRYVRLLNDRRIPVWRIYLYGSHAKGAARPDSDIDLAIFLDQDDIDGFREDVELMRLRWDIDLRIEPHAFARSDFDETDPYIREIIDSGARIV
ncbi:MAG TPA: nucleotidyltransferase domain-containing protein [Candidatus Hydrogenedentes bacterium]|nr:nucleotidyltransferase domain-containing protein [Candidatus Hydrogenedentota bacterium]HNT86707.1 nucleotidyltransferase domain-containing protein [Candidatus Hydrogenedentota bacterium]